MHYWIDYITANYLTKRDDWEVNGLTRQLVSLVNDLVRVQSLLPTERYSEKLESSTASRLFVTGAALSTCLEAPHTNPSFGVVVLRRGGGGGIRQVELNKLRRQGCFGGGG